MTREEAVKYIRYCMCEGRLVGNTKPIIDEKWQAGVMAIKALKLIPDNATNGDVIKALFPNDKVIEDAFIEVMHYGNYKQILSDWWNAPYKAGRRGKE